MSRDESPSAWRGPAAAGVRWMPFDVKSKTHASVNTTGKPAKATMTTML